jgi:hypothetical protein
VSLFVSLALFADPPGGQPTDRTARTAQRTRSARCPRLRIVVGIVQEPAALHAAVATGFDLSAAFLAVCNRFAPATPQFFKIMLVADQAHTAFRALAFPAPSLPRPPPVFI